MTATTTIHADGGEEAHTVFIDPGQTSDEDGYVLPPSICIDRRVDLTPTQARQAASALTRLAEQLDPTPASPAVLGAIEDAAGWRGVTLGELATVAGVDLDSVTAADVTKLGMALMHWEQRLAEHLLRVMGQD